MDEYYKIEGETLKRIADCTRALVAIKSTLTPEQIIFYLRLLSEDWNLKTEAIDTFERVLFSMPNMELKKCIESFSTHLQDEKRLNTYTETLESKYFIQTPQMSLNSNIKDTLINANPHAGELVYELSVYDDIAISTEFKKLAHLRKSWTFFNTQEAIDVGNIGIIEIDTNIIPQDRITAIEVNKVT